MRDVESNPEPRRSFEFSPTPAVEASRRRRRFVDCSVCQVDNSQYLFHRTGVRFVRCRTCGVVYVNPVNQAPTNYFDIEAARPLYSSVERGLCASDFSRFLELVEEEYASLEQRPLARTVLVGKYLREFRDLPAAHRVGLAIAEIDDDTFHRMAVEGDTSCVETLLTHRPDVVILHELLEACGDPAGVMQQLVGSLPANTWFVVTYTNVASMPARLLRRYWPPFFDVKTAFFNTGHLTALFARFGLVTIAQFPFPVVHTVEYVAKRLAPRAKATRLLEQSQLGKAALPIRAGNWVAIFRATPRAGKRKEKLSIVMPVFNEAAYCEKVIETVLAKELSIDKEIILVEGNSTDGTREIVQSFEGRPGVTLLFEDRPRGKGHAVRTGLRAVTGSIVLIQDADFEYDIDDYDALLDPILQHRAAFVLGSRSLGLDDWKVRQFGRDRLKGLALNAAQLLFARTYNVLYQQKIKDVNTMFKVFRTDCLDHFDLESDGFELDMELACKLTLSGYAPMEVPVNYVARSFAEGKKIRFGRESCRSYWAFFKYRFVKWL